MSEPEPQPPPEAPPERRQRLERITAAFCPHSPIAGDALFRGREPQVKDVLEAVGVRGLSVAIYGERGVGKTSLANVARARLKGRVPNARINCTERDSFSSALRRAFSQVRLAKDEAPPGFTSELETRTASLADELPSEEVSPDLLATLLARLKGGAALVFDEFDRVPRDETPIFADLIKCLSDRGAAATVILVGVAEDVNALISGHGSIERCLRQIHLPRMSAGELGEIVVKGLASAEMTLASPHTLEWMLNVSQGFPHYVHLLAQHAASAAAEEDRAAVEERDVMAGIHRALARVDSTHREAWHTAVSAGKRKGLWAPVVAACALAECDERGYFTAAAVGEQLGRLLKQRTTRKDYAYYLSGLSETQRGPLLEKLGPAGRQRYRFPRPFMRPFIIMRAIEDGLIRLPGPSA